jgi:hypothetical protein
VGRNAPDCPHHVTAGSGPALSARHLGLEPHAPSPEGCPATQAASCAGPTVTASCAGVVWSRCGAWPRSSTLSCLRHLQTGCAVPSKRSLTQYQRHRWSEWRPTFRRRRVLFVKLDQHGCTPSRSSLRTDPAMNRADRRGLNVTNWNGTARNR